MVLVTLAVMVNLPRTWLRNRIFRNCGQNALSLSIGESNTAAFPRGHSFLKSVAYETFARAMEYSSFPTNLGDDCD